MVLRCLPLVAVIAVVLLIHVGSAPAAAAPGAATPACWKALLNDEYDGQIGSGYEIRCYRAAFDHVACNAVYGSLCWDIRRALASGIRELKQRHMPVRATTIVPPPGSFVLKRPQARLESVLRFAALTVLGGTLVLWAWARVRRRPRAL